ncbi:hypothetical protein TrRE_jg3615 [Triparma retinervis]|uniref:Uncharacterized protein n=1 Tax=Triparma retinervis TaxID=2557542 RepID=A0A9W6ZNF7_9STRA|nr:hypothetical protein TrRE_jg3615 [Triparma retinervis]
MIRVLSLLLAASAVSCFSTAPTAFSRGLTIASPRTSFSVVCSGPEDDEEGGLDLDLGEMFEMFDAADKEVDFDEALDKVKGKKDE